MIQLWFNVRGQTISRADRFYVVEKSNNYLQANFNFVTSDWDNLQKIAVFTKNGVSYKIILDNEGVAMVPWELLTETGTVEVSVYGVGYDEQAILETVNKATFTVQETGYTPDAENQPEPTPNIWEQVLARTANVDGGTYDDWKEDEG